MASCTFDVMEGVAQSDFLYREAVDEMERTDPEAAKKLEPSNEIMTSCACGGATKVKGRGYLKDVTIRKVKRGGIAIAEVCGGVALVTGAVAYTCLTMDLYGAYVIGGSGVGVVIDGGRRLISSVQDDDYLFMKNKIPPCTKDAWKDATSISLDWNGLASIKELEGLKNVKKVTAMYNPNVVELPDFTTMPALESIDVSGTGIPPFACDGKRYKGAGKFNKEKVRAVRACQSRGTFAYSRLS